MGDDFRDLRDAFGRFGTGVAAITLRDADARAHGLTINSFVSVSLDPPLVAWCLDNASELAPLFEGATRFTVNILAAAQQELAETLAARDGHVLCDTQIAENIHEGVPLKGALAHFECGVHARIPAGDHLILLGRIVSFARQKEDAPPLIYYGGRFRRLA